MNMKNVIVAGATGFIGSALRARLRRDLGPDARVIGIGSNDVDLTNRDATFDWFSKTCSETTIDHVFHLAALYKAGDWPVLHPATQFFANMSMNVNMLEGWARFAPSARLVSVVSYCMYPPNEEAHSEAELWGTEPEDYLFAYAFTKKGLLVGQRAYRQEHGLECSSVVLPTIFGPGDSFEENSHVVGALIGKFVRAERSGAEFVEVWGDGSQQREFLFVDDAVDGILAASERTDVDVLNLGTGIAYSIDELAHMIKKASGFQGEIRYNSDRFVGVRCRALDVSRARKEIGWTAGTTTEQGIQITVDAFRQQLDSGAPTTTVRV